MKIVISSTGNTLDSNVDQRFGRTRWLIVYDTETKDSEAVENTQNSNAPQGAGVSTAEMVANMGCNVIITGNLGPKAYQVLNAAGIKGYSARSTTVKEAVEMLNKGELQEISGPNVKGHWK
jgi:predicted Fe-Mo cluster-binding NifX family protein